MKSEKRLYIGNLPPNLSEDVIKKHFRLFGKITSIDIRKKADNSSYAFLNVDSNDSVHLHSTIKKYSNQRLNGHTLNIELAKESFMSRLKKERTEAGSKTPLVNSSPSKPHTNGYISSDSDDNTRGGVQMFRGTNLLSTKSDDRSSKSINTSKEETVLSRFESFSDFWKDPVEECGSSPESIPNLKDEHQKTGESKTVVKGKKNKIKECSTDLESCNKKVKSKKAEHNSVSKMEKHSVDEMKRLNSIKEKMKTISAQQKLIKDALNSQETSLNKKIKFEAEEVNDFHENKMTLFDESDSEDIDEPNIVIKEQFEGKKGKKLLELQSRINNDERFKLDHRFRESEDEKSEADEIEVDDFQKEKQKQLALLEEVLGHSIQKESKKSTKQMTQPMLRFDPTKKEHKKLLNAASEEMVPKVKEKKENKRKLNETVDNVDNEKFYKVEQSVSDTFKKAENEEFSLLKMFGHEEEEVDNSKCLNIEGVTVHQKKSKLTVNDGADEVTSDIKKTETQSSVKGVWKEPFFFKSKDARLQEGIDFINMKNSEEAKKREEMYAEHRIKIKSIFKTLMKRNNRRKNPFKKKIGGQSRKVGKKIGRRRYR